MKQEDKELLIKDLCARLPYGVKILIQDTFEYSIVSPERHVLDVSNFSDIFCFNYEKLDKRMKKAMRERPDDIVIKPYLFPLSSMTEELKYEFYLMFIANDCDFDYFRELCLDNGKWHKLLTSLLGVEEIIDWFHKNHIDYRGLIPMGLAIDASGLNIY